MIAVALKDKNNVVADAFQKVNVVAVVQEAEHVRMANAYVQQGTKNVMVFALVMTNVVMVVL